MPSTIQISRELQSALKKLKLFESESYEELIWDLVENYLELSEETKKAIEKSRKDFKKGKFYSLQQVEKEAGI
jgi:hypothetical protein